MFEVVQLTSDLNIGGMQNFVKQHAKYLSELKYKNSIIIWLQDGISSSGKQYLNASSLGDFKSFIRFRNLVKIKVCSGHQVIFHSHGITLLLSLIVIDLLLRNKIQWVHTVHNMAQNEAGKLRRIIWVILFRYFRVSPVVISDLVYESFKKHYRNIQFINKIENKI